MIDKKLIALLGDKKKKLAQVTILNIIGLICGVAITASVCYAIAIAVGGEVRVSAYIICAVVAVVATVVRYVSGRVSANIKCKLGNAVKRDMRNKLVKKMYKLGIGGNKTNDATMMQMSVEGVEQLDLYYTSYLPQFFYAMIAPLILFVICVVIEWKTALVLLVAVPLIPVSIVAVSKYAKKIFAKYWGKYTSMGDGFLDAISGMKELKIFNADKKKQGELSAKSEEFRKITMKVLVMQLVSITIMDLVAFGGAGIAIVVSLTSANAQAILPMEALFLILISAEFFLPMRALGSAFHVAMNGATAGKNIIEFLETPERQWGDNKVASIQKVTLNGVEFGYIPEKSVLNGINITFNKGLSAIVGESGSGKSTITSLLTGANKADSGAVMYNDKNIFSYDRNELYNNIALVSCGTFVFNDSIRNNFKLAKSDASDSEIMRALERVNLKDFVESAGGLDYVVLEDSENISGGQRQRLALAINLVADKKMYIFDEATSNIDVESEAIIMENIRALSSDCVVVLISHRLQNVVQSDCIYMLENGIVSESGKHDDLMTKAGGYSKLYKRQYQLENQYKGGAL